MNIKERDNEIRYLSNIGTSNTDIAKKFDLSRERVRQIVDNGEHPKYYEYAYHNIAVKKFTNQLERIERKLLKDRGNGRITTYVFNNINTANAITELLDTWKPTKDSEPCNCDVCKS